jgi:23S rRNA (uracil1939-C5)-methyltransferase
MKQPAKSPKIFEVQIEKLVYRGQGLGHHHGKVVFVPFSVPGDLLSVHAVEEKKKFFRAEIQEIISPGAGRVSPACPHFAACGGCHWQQLKYSGQVETKRQILEETLHHHLPQTRGLPISMKPCSQPFEYRSRARVQLRGSGAQTTVGFFRIASHHVENVFRCPLLRPPLNEALDKIRKSRIEAKSDPGRPELDIACSDEGIAFSENAILRRTVGEFQYSIAPSVFFQANDFMVAELVSIVRDLAGKAGSGFAADLFAGVGLFSLPLARLFETVVAVENSPAASRFCAVNASNAGITNIHAICADVTAWLESETTTGWDLVVLDPPRMGAGPGVIEGIRKKMPKIIIYVSCDPQTMARDLSRIAGDEYRVDHIEGLDLFPQTYHFETVVRLIKS